MGLTSLSIILDMTKRTTPDRMDGDFPAYLDQSVNKSPDLSMDGFVGFYNYHWFN